MPVSFHVLLAISVGFEGFLAVWTHIWAFRGVDCLVSPQTPTGGKQAAALFTFVGALACVCLVVRLEHTQ